MQYVALLRGIAPTNPNMRNDKLRGVFEKLGFQNVQTVISSGNVLFESDSLDITAMESQIEAALPKELDFNSTTIIRSKQDLQRIVDADPFEGKEHSNGVYLLVTFAKSPIKTALKMPHPPNGQTYAALSAKGREIYSVINLLGTQTSDHMQWLERQFGKEISSRTYKTVQRILKKFEG